jgi:hypothetical protein
MEKQAKDTVATFYARRVESCSTVVICRVGVSTSID